MLISYYTNKKSSPRLPSWQPSLIFFNIPIESGSIIKPCTLKHFQVAYRLHKAGYWTIAEQASKAQFQLNRYMYQFKDIPPTIVYDLFVKMIFPVLNYAGEVWGFHSASDIEKVHLSFMKHLLGVKRSTQNVFVYGEFCTRPMKVLRKIQILKYWVKIVHGKKIVVCF